MSDLAALVSRLRELEKAATPGEWEVIPDTDEIVHGATITDAAGDWIAEMLLKDAELASALRNAAPRLLALVECGEALRDAIRLYVAEDNWNKVRAALARWDAVSTKGE